VRIDGVIRKAVRADFPAIVEVWKAQGIAWPERAASAAALEEADSRRDPGRLCLRFLAEIEGRAAGFLSCIETDAYNGHRAFSMNIAVLPDLRRQGLGTALFRRLAAELSGPAVPAASEALTSAASPAAAEAPVRAILCADGYTICPGGMRFLEGLGFRETWRETPVLLDVAGCDSSALPGLLASLESKGLRIRSLAELAGDPDRDRKLYELYDSAKRQVPTEDGYLWERQDFDEWRAEQIEDPSTLLDAYLVVLHGEDYVGLKEVGMLRDSGAIQCGLMAVLPPFQRLGLARAMQLLTVEYAKRIGCPSLKSCTATSNRPMLELYEGLGYRRLYEWAQYQREI